ncbi:unnamed protein product [Rhizophagus irregularis]|uniref:Uncharacterized protein n=1 Tax=Rhizophagus irregularis TaxID=588596 RepID=A0A2I1GZQ1_9GLOM|nr:hypothetical protein RhiirA4_469528 [Rhizophagus irregularis]CAB4411716.1 unnamed protein product [Rhizophagus irregularis]
MGPLGNWLLLQQAPKHEELVTKTYDEYLVKKSKKSINIFLPEVRKPNEGVENFVWSYDSNFMELSL